MRFLANIKNKDGNQNVFQNNDSEPIKKYRKGSHRSYKELEARKNRRTKHQKRAALLKMQKQSRKINRV